MEARLERLRAVIKNDLDKLPDLPPKAEPLPEVKLAAKPNIKAQSKPEVKSQPKPAPKPNIGSILWPDAQPDSDSDDSEADCEIEFIRIDEEERVKELEEEDSSDENGSTIVSTMGKGMSPGQLTPVGQSFAAILAFSKFPYRYIPKGESEKVADRFFNGGKFFMREWDL